jgi:hypothetical protein
LQQAFEGQAQQLVESARVRRVGEGQREHHQAGPERSATPADEAGEAARVEVWSHHVAQYL